MLRTLDGGGSIEGSNQLIKGRKRSQANGEEGIRVNRTRCIIIRMKRKRERVSKCRSDFCAFEPASFSFPKK